MPKHSRYARIAITLPEEDLAAADALARQRDRPRSWIIAEAIRQYTATPAPAPAATGLGPYRRDQLLADLRLSVEARVRAAEETARVALARRGIRAQRVIGFDRYEDYLAWKRLEEVGAG